MVGEKKTRIKVPMIGQFQYRRVAKRGESVFGSALLNYRSTLALSLTKPTTGSRAVEMQTEISNLAAVIAVSPGS